MRAVTTLFVQAIVLHTLLTVPSGASQPKSKQMVSSQALSFSSDVSVRCPRPQYPGPPRMVGIILTCAAYRKTRLHYLLESWASELDALIVAADAEISEIPVDAGMVVVPENASDAFVTPWRERTANVQAKTPSEYRGRQEEKWILALDAVSRCLPLAETVLMTDDDTFVPVAMMHRFVASLDTSEPQIIGIPSTSSNFIYPDGLVELAKLRPELVPIKSNGQLHCGGGPGVLISRGAMRRLGKLGGAAKCLRWRQYIENSTPKGDVVLGVCLAALLDIRCKFPSNVVEWSCHAVDLPVVAFVGKQQIEREPDRPWFCLPDPAITAKRIPSNETREEESVRCMREALGTVDFPSAWKAFVTFWDELDAATRARAEVESSTNIPIATPQWLSYLVYGKCVSQPTKKFLLMAVHYHQEKSRHEL